MKKKSKIVTLSSTPITLKNNRCNNSYVIVRDVKQGNCNEIYTNDKLLYVYDYGTYIHATKAEVTTLINKTYNLYKAHNPVLIISHWDLDHYHLLKGLISNKQPLPFSAIIIIGHLPNITSQRLYEKIKNKVPFFIVSPPKRNALPKLKKVSTRVVDIYAPDCYQDRNHSGLVCVMNENDRKWVLPGDSSYEQIKDFFYSPQHINFVLPHHGGEAGDVTNLNTGNIQKVAISAQRKIYGHPFKSVTNHFVGKNIMLTEKQGDITLN